MSVVYVSKDQVVVSPIVPPPHPSGGPNTAGTSYTLAEQAMLQAAYDAHRAVGILR